MKRYNSTLARLSAVLLTMLICSPATEAAVIVFDNAVDYDAATGPDLFLIDFNGSPDAVVDGSTISPEVIFGSPEASDPTDVVWSSDALTDAGSTTATNAVGPISAMFATPVFGFALDFLSAETPSNTIELFDDVGAPIMAVASPTGNGFFGVTSDIAIGSAVFYGGIFAISEGRDRIFIDNLRASAAPAPEPSTLLMVASALFGAFGAGRLRRSLSPPATRM